MGQQPPGGYPPQGPPQGGGYPPQGGQPPPGQYPPQGPPPGQYPGQQPYQQMQPMSPQGRPLAEWWKRLLAYLLDSLVVGVPATIIMAAIGVGAFAGSDLECDPVTGVCTGDTTGFFVVYLTSYLVVGVLAFAYLTFMNGSERGQTVGKMALKIQVRDEVTGGPLGYGKAAVRTLIYLVLSLFTCGIGFLLDGLWPLWDPKRQALHDKPAGSLVVDAP
jgi:uncharacterized RDD family membrane protein YckC